jgi:hypothetical protein
MSSCEAGDVHHPAVGRFRFHGGKLEEFKRLSAQAMETARAKDTGTLQYEIYFRDISPSASSSSGTGTPRRSPSTPRTFGELGQAILATGLVSSELLGEPGAELRAALADSPVRLFTPFLSS